MNSYARNLAEHVDAEGKPRAGIRTEVPYLLRTIFKMLDDHRHELRTCYGREFKRHVKFDDHERSFFLSVRMPGAKYWERILASFVQRQISLRENSQENTRKFGKTLEQSMHVDLAPPRIPMQLARSETSSTRGGFVSDTGSGDSGVMSGPMGMRRPRLGSAWR